MYRVEPVWHDILQHPLLQYIPLGKDPIISRTEAFLPSSRPQIKAFNKPADLKPSLILLNIPTETINTINWKEELPLLTLNLDAIDLKYRTSKIIVLGENRPGLIELFSVKRDYFYREKIYFSVFDSRGRVLNTPLEIVNIDLA